MVRVIAEACFNNGERHSCRGYILVDSDINFYMQTKEQVLEYLRHGNKIAGFLGHYEYGLYEYVYTGLNPLPVYYEEQRGMQTSAVSVICGVAASSKNPQERRIAIFTTGAGIEIVLESDLFKAVQNKQVYLANAYWTRENQFKVVEGRLKVVKSDFNFKKKWDARSTKDIPYKSVVTTCCYNTIVEHWATRASALADFRDSIECSEGAERDRYVQIYLKLQQGLTYCDDKGCKGW